jgi:hypothetical protein
MNHSRLFESKFVVVGLASILLAGCPGPMSASVIFNNTAAPITVAYTMRSRARPLDNRMVCALQTDASQLPRVRAGVPKRQLGARRTWKPVVGYEAIQDECNVEFDLAPGFSALIFSGGICSDYEKDQYGDSYESIFERLEIRTKNGIIVFTDWEVSKQFTRVNGDICLLEIN